MATLRNKKEKPSVAELAYLVIANDPSYETVLLLSYLIDAGKVSLKDQVVTKHDKTTDLKRAIVLLGEPGIYEPEFYKEKTAKTLLEIDPDFFNQSGDKGAPWLEECLVEWTRDPERERKGFYEGYTNSVDVWAKTIVKSLNSNIFTENLFSAAIQLGLRETASFILDVKPDFWYGLDVKKTPHLRSASGSWAWEMGLSKGLDPYRKIDGKTPLWRAVLPKSSQVIAHKNSIRYGVEAWIDDELSKENADPLLEDVRRQLTVSVMEHQIHTLGKDKFLRSDQWEKFTSELPPCWVNWEVRHIPAWLAPLRRIEAVDTSKWMDMLVKQPLALKNMDEFSKAMLYLITDESSLNLSKAVKANRVLAKDINWKTVFEVAASDPKKLKSSLMIISSRGSATEELLAARMELLMMENTTQKALKSGGGLLRL